LSLLQQIIHNLSAAEAKRVTLWLEAELHNRREDCRALFRLRRQSEEPIPPETEFALIYPAATGFDAAKYRQLEHQLLKRLEAFLAWDTFNRDPNAPSALLMKAYRERDLDDHRCTRDPFIRLFYLVARLQLDEPTKAETAFTQVTDRLVEFHHRLPADDRRNLLLMAINYGLRRANTGSEPAIEVTFVLYKLGLKLGLLHDRGRLSIFAFNNILGLAIRLQEVDWAADFLDKHQRELPDKGGSEVLALGRARLALATGKDGDALYFLQQADFKDFIHHLTARVIQLKIYFKQDSYTLLHSHIGSTRKLLTRRKRVGYHLQNYRNIFQLANAVIRLTPGDDKAREELRARIGRTDPCTERNWLLSLVE